MSLTDEELWAELNRIYGVEEKPADPAANPQWAETERLHAAMRQQNKERLLAGENPVAILRDNSPIKNPEEMTAVHNSPP